MHHPRSCRDTNSTNVPDNAGIRRGRFKERSNDGDVTLCECSGYFDFNGDPSRQRHHSNGGPRVLPAVPEEIDKEARRTIRHSRLPGEVWSACNEYRKPQEGCNPLQFANCIFDRSKTVEDALARALLRHRYVHFSAHRTRREQRPVRHRYLA